jgi:hypothetical protein
MRINASADFGGDDAGECENFGHHGMRLLSLELAERVYHCFRESVKEISKPETLAWFS